MISQVFFVQMVYFNTYDSVYVLEFYTLHHFSIVIGSVKVLMWRQTGGMIFVHNVKLIMPINLLYDVVFL